MSSDAPAPETRQEVRRRRVMYIPGYDPVPPRKYRERYRTQSARQAELSGYAVEIGPKRGDGRFGWSVTGRIEGAETTAEVEVMYWADIVRGSMDQSIAGTYGQLARTAWAYIGSGALFRLMRLRKGPVIAALYPVVVLLLQLVLAGLLGFVAYTVLLATAFYAVITATGGPVPAPLDLALLALAAIAGVVAALAFLRWCRRRDHVLAWYLMHDYAFSAQHGGAYPPAQEARMAEFADRIAAALATEVDEVLIVGHSSGAYIAVSILADLIRDGRVPPGGPALSLLTLGHVVPMVSFLPRATRLRADLACLSARDELTWVDVTAPGDGCAFALCDPVAVSGVAPEGKRWPLVLSAAFSRTLKPATWSGLRWRLFELHFQYLNAFDNLPGTPGDYDYFRITAGPLTLASRFATRKPSASRIERPVNRHTGQAA
ncbi:hypothetical protein [Roseicyclus persicicus]|uniref:Alpha/beta hydrolase n=1 Tax=Roseicyclus persicicus TaxID=2650661 RepID=A0A7X6H3I3_9RHOB|nr:hypothetical protein [Roseibacterium persicicum]NKX46117.1 hypothetical protein [Roseibacterium persicicum]